MDLGRLRRELWKAVRIGWTDERWLPAGAVLAGAADALWVGVTGGVLLVLAPGLDVSLAVEPWTSTTSGLAVVLGLLWVVLPAAVVTGLVDRRIRNQDGKLRLCYRLSHPAVLLVPPALVLAAVAGLMLGAGVAPVALQAVLVAAATVFLVRTVAYGYRVVSFSLPRLFQAMVFGGACVLGVTTLAGAGVALGYGETVRAVGRGLAGVTGLGGVEWLATGTVTVGEATVAAMTVAATVALTSIAVGYLSVQFFAGLVLRLRKPTVPRSRLRSGQRFPAFLRPAAAETVPTPDRPTKVTAPSSTATSGAAEDRTRVSQGGGRAAGTDGGARTAGSTSEASGSSAPEPGDTTPGADSGTDPTAASGSTPVGSTATAESSDAANLSDPDTPRDADASAGTADPDAGDPDDVSHTRVFSPERDLSDADRTGEDAVAGRPAADDRTPTDADGEAASAPAGPGWHCPACGAEYDADVGASFCPDCGARLEQA